MRFAPSSKAFLLVAVLAGCTGRNAVVAPGLPPVPPALEACFDRTVALPTEDDWTGETVTRVIGELRRSELSKTRCGKQLLAFYSDLRKELARERN